MTAYYSLHSRLDYKCLLFCRESPGFDLRVDHFFSFRSSLVSTPQLNSLTTELRLFYNLGRTEYVTMSHNSSVILFVSVAAETCDSEPLVNNGLFRLVVTETCVSEPLASNGLFWLSCHNIIIAENLNRNGDRM
jgi:hypothetical protein